MAHTVNGSVGIQSGANAPSSVRRVLILGYQDGATEGVIELAPLGQLYQFRQIGETHNPDGLDCRTYALEPLPANAMVRLESVIGAHIKPHWPIWIPVWQFSDDPTRCAVEEQTDAILAEAGSAVWQISTDDPVSFSQFHATPLIAKPAACD